MPTVIQVKLTLADPATGTYNMELPQEVVARTTQIQRDTVAEAVTDLLPKELALCAEGPSLVARLADGTAVKVALGAV
jgi:hypothetical protein